MAVFNQDFATAVLLEAVFKTDLKACQKFAITERTLRNYRRRLATDPAFSAYFYKRQAELFQGWADEMKAAVGAGARLLTEAALTAESAQKKNPEMVRAVAGAVKACAEVLLTKQMIDARAEQK
jgi:hypothetical protein